MGEKHFKLRAALRREASVHLNRHCINKLPQPPNGGGAALFQVVKNPHRPPPPPPPPHTPSHHHRRRHARRDRQCRRRRQQHLPHIPSKTLYLYSLIIRLKNQITKSMKHLGRKTEQKKKKSSLGNAIEWV